MIHNKDYTSSPDTSDIKYDFAVATIIRQHKI